MNIEVFVKSGLTQKEISELFEVSRVMVNRYIAGKAVPTNKLLKRRIAQVEAMLSERETSLPDDKEERQRYLEELKSKLN